MDKTFIQHLEDAVLDIKDDFDEYVISPQSYKVQESRRTSYSRGALDALDMLVRHFKEINNAK